MFGNMILDDIGYFVYFITDNANAMKIGKSRNPWRRLSQLQANNSNNLEILTVFALDSKKEMDHLEKQFHKYFDKCKLHGEWFKYDDVIDWLHNIHKLDGFEFDGSMSDKEWKDYVYDYL